MKNYRKLISIILTLCMVMQVLPAFATQEAVQASSGVSDDGVIYIINDDFGAPEDEDRLNGWVLDKVVIDDTDMTGGMNPTTNFTTQAIEGEENNYAMYYNTGYKAAWEYSHISKVLETPIAFTDDADVVIETRMKQSAADGRAYLKYNLVPSATVSHEYNFDWGTLVRNDAGTIAVPSGYGKWETYMKELILTNNTGVTDWLKIKVAIHGDNTASYVISNDDGTKVDIINKTSIKHLDGASWVEDVLNTVDFRLRAVTANSLLVDYVRVYKQYHTNISVNEIQTYNRPVEVTFDTECGSSVLKDVVGIYNSSDELVEATNTIDETGKIVTIIPAKPLTLGEEYKVKVNTANTPKGYLFNNTEISFNTVEVEYIINDDFGAPEAEDRLNGWTLDQTIIDGTNMTGGMGAGNFTTQAIDGESNNYAMYYNTGWTTAWEHSHISKVLETPVAFTADADVVIETRMKQSAADGRAYLKYNLVPSATVSNEYNFNWGTLVQNNAGIISVPAGYGKWETYMHEQALTNNTGVTDWLKIKVAIHSDNTASYVISNDDGTKVDIINKTSIKHLDGANWVEDVLNTVDFRLRGGSTNKNSLLVDYVRVYKQYHTNISVNKFQAYNRPVEVTVDAEYGSPAFKDIVGIYNSSDELVKATNTIDETGKVVTITPENPLVSGEEYKIKVNTENIPKGYVFNNPEISFNATQVEYIINDDFGAPEDEDRLNGWVLDKVVIDDTDMTGGMNPTTNFTTQEIDGEENNYAMYYNTGWTEAWEYSHISKVLETPVAFTADADVVIETRMKQSAADGRAYLKYNLVPSATVSHEYNFDWGTLVRNDSGTIAVPNGYGKWETYMHEQVLTNNTGVTDWLKIKVAIHSDNTASYVISNDDGTKVDVINKTSIKHLDGANWVEDVLNTVDFRLRGGSTNKNSLLVDYVRVYKEEYINLDVDGLNVELGEATEVYVDGYNGDFSKCVKLYNADKSAEVEAVKTYNAQSGTVSIKPAVPSTEKTVYKLVCTPPAGYKFKGENEFTVTAHKAVLTAIDEDFEGEASNWEKTNDRITGTVCEEDGNNYLRVSGSDLLKTEASTSFSYYKTFEDGFIMDADGYTVFEAKIRTTGSDYRKIIRLNSDFTTEETAYTTNALWTVNFSKGNIASAYYCSAADPRNAESKVMSANTDGAWYTVRTIYDNLNRKISFELLDANGVCIEKVTEHSMVQGVSGNPAAWWFNYADNLRTDREKLRYIKNISFALRSDALTALDTPATFDIDDIKLYNTSEKPDFEERFNVSIVDENGNEVEGAGALKYTGGVFKTKVDVNSATSQSFSVITALYKDSKLQTLKTKAYENVSKVNEAVNETTVPDGDGYVVKAFVWNNMESFIPLLSPVEASSDAVYQTVYMSALGNDSNDGISAPVATLTRAQEIASEMLDESEVHIEIADGEYYVNQPEQLNVSGNKQNILKIKAAGDNAYFIGGVSFEVDNAVKVESDAILNRLSTPAAKDYLYVIDLSEYNIPETALPGVYSHQLNEVEAPGITKGQWVTEPKTSCEVFLEDTPLTLARYPNDDYMTISEDDIVDAGANPRYWMDDKKNDVENYVAYDDRDVTDVVKIKCSDERLAKWGTAEEMPILFGFWYHDWAVQAIPVAQIDTENKVITTKYPSHYSVLDDGQRRYYVYNLLEEIDSKGEYFIDRVNKKLYFYKTSDMAGKRLFLSLNNIDGFEISANNIVLEGINITAFRGKGINLWGNNITVKNCTVSNTADYGIKADGYNNKIKNCHIINVNGGISLYGGQNSTLTHGNNRVENNEIEKFSRLDKLHVPAVYIRGCGNIIKNNEIHDSEFSAMMLNGADHEISYNEIYNVCKETDDAGAIYSGRSWTARGNKIMYNYFHDIESSSVTNEGASPVSGIFFDDHLAGGYAYGNIFANIKGYGIRGNAGREHTISNNIFVKCSDGGTLISNSSENASDFGTQISGVEDYIGNTLWETKYPILFTKDAEGNTIVNTAELVKSSGNVYTNNFAAACGTHYTFGTNAEALATISGNRDTDDDIFNGDYSSNAQKIVTFIPDFSEIPFELIGIQ